FFKGKHKGKITSEVKKRFNILKIKKKSSVIIKFLEKFKDPLIGLLLVSCLISLCLSQFSDAFSIAMVLNLCNNFGQCRIYYRVFNNHKAVFIVVTVGFAQEYKSEKSLKLLERLVPYTCSCLRNAQKIKLDAAELVPGDIICLNMGDRVPADLRLIEAYDLEVDESSLTGEADAVHKNSHVVKIPDGKTLRRNLDLNERTNIVYMGTLIRNGTGRGVVVSIGEETEIGKVFAIMQDVEEKKSPLQVKMDELGVALTKMSFAIIAVICLLGFIQGKNYLELFTIAVSLAVAAIPEGLPIVVTVTLALGVLRMAKRKAIIRRMPAVEALGSLILIS
ncbi:hypothetical protein Zmor_004476, partial [Zophobas morio]